jgi:hypothetical protein
LIGVSLVETASILGDAPLPGSPVMRVRFSGGSPRGSGVAVDPLPYVRRGLSRFLERERIPGLVLSRISNPNLATNAAKITYIAYSGEELTILAASTRWLVMPKEADDQIFAGQM